VHGGLKEMKVDMVKKMFNSMKPVMDERICWFTYKDDKPIAFFINIPDLNHYFKYFNGKFGLLQKLVFLWLKYFNKPRRFFGIIFGVVPEHQGTGVDSFMIVESAKVLQKQKQYDLYEMQWIGDFNPKMIGIAQTLADTKQFRHFITYRYNFDRTKKVVRHPILG
jgi:hypothetical protein